MENYNNEMNLAEEMDFPFVDALCNYFRAEQPQLQVLNIKRYYEILFAKEALDDLLHQNGEDVCAEINFAPMFGSASLSVEVESFEVTDMTAFSLAMDRADNFEFYPLTNGKIRLAFVFRNMMISIS